MRITGGRWLGQAAGWLADRPLAALSLLGILGAISAFGLTLDAPREQFQKGPLWESADRASAEFGSDESAGVVAVFGPVTDDEHLASLQALESRLEAVPGVAQVVTPWEVALPFTTMEAASRHPMVRDVIVVTPQHTGGAKRGASVGASQGNGEGLLMPLVFDSDVDEVALWPTLEDVCQQVADGSGLDVGVTGQRAVIDAQTRAFHGERLRFLGLGTLLGFLLASLSFRSVRATFLAGLPPLVGVFISVGLVRLLGLGADGFTTIVLPLLVLTIGFTDSLHVVVEAVRARNDGRASDCAGAAVSAVRRLGGACALTSLTTAIGFGSMAVSGNALIVDFGLSCALGTAITFVCVIASVPLFARTGLGRALEDVTLAEHLDDSNRERPTRVSAPVMGVLSWTLLRPRTVATVGAMATVVFAWLSFGLEGDRRAMVDLADGSHAATTLARVDTELGGVFPVYVRLDWNDGVSLVEAASVAQSAADVLEREGVVGGVMGLHRFAEFAGAKLVGANFARDGNAADNDLEIAVELARAAPRVGGLTDAFVDVDGQRALLHARVTDAGSVALNGAFARIRGALAGLGGGDVRVELVGNHIAYMDAVADVMTDLRKSLFLAALLILGTLSLAFRSWRLGLASVVPNLLPLGVAAAMLLLGSGSIDVSTLTALTLSLGIATDDTIHVLYRWRLERANGAEPRAAARRAVAHTLPALGATTLTLTAAFGQLLTSELPTIRDFGTLAATTLVVAFLSDVWLLPATLVTLTRPDRLEDRHDSTHEQ